MILVYDVLKIMNEDFADICDEYGFIRIGLENDGAETKLSYIVDEPEKNLQYYSKTKQGLFKNKAVVWSVHPENMLFIKFPQSKENFDKTFAEENFSPTGEIDENSEDPNIVDVIVKCIQTVPYAFQIDLLKQVPTSLLLDTTAGTQILNAIKVRDKNAKKDVLDVVGEKLAAVKSYKKSTEKQESEKNGLLTEYCKKVDGTKQK